MSNQVAAGLTEPRRQRQADHKLTDNILLVDEEVSE